MTVTRYIKHFSSWISCYVCFLASLPPVIVLGIWLLPLDAHHSKYYHLEFGKSVIRSNLSEADESSISKIFKEFAYHLIAISRRSRNNDDFQIKGKIYAFDSSTIDLCLNVFRWTKLQKNKGSIKLHTLFDLTTRFLLLSYYDSDYK